MVEAQQAGLAVVAACRTCGRSSSFEIAVCRNSVSSLRFFLPDSSRLMVRPGAEEKKENALISACVLKSVPSLSW